MPASIGVNLRVTGHCRQGGRKYMEDFFSVAYQQTEDEKDLEYAFFGIYDGHGGSEAAAFAKEHLMESIVKHRGFWSDDDEEVLRSIKDGFIHTHLAMWKIHDKWPKTQSGLPSTAGTTASVAFIRRGKIYVGHVGDSGITLGYQEPGRSKWSGKSLTNDHKPECEQEMRRIEQSGGKVVSKSGVPRVVWNRPRIGHKGPVRRSTPIDEIPFLAVARSLGDLWSYNSALDEFVVSPMPDVAVIPIDTSSFRCLIFGTDGLYNMLSPQLAVQIVQQAEQHGEMAVLCEANHKLWVNPSRCLVEKALERWSSTKMRADNTSVITLMLDPPGPPRAQVLRHKLAGLEPPYSASGLRIETRYYNGAKTDTDLPPEEVTPPSPPPSPDASLPTSPSRSPEPSDLPSTSDIGAASSQTDLSALPSSSSTTTPQVESSVPLDESVIEEDDGEDTRESSSDDVVCSSAASQEECTSAKDEVTSADDIQINEVSSSVVDCCFAENRVKRKTAKTIRRINLRSGGTKEEITSSKTATAAAAKEKPKGSATAASAAAAAAKDPSDNSTPQQAQQTGRKRVPLGENVPETSAVQSNSRNSNNSRSSSSNNNNNNVEDDDNKSDAVTVDSSKESRVLRERKNTPNGTVQKRKFSLKPKMALSTEKRKLLQSVLFRQKDSIHKEETQSKSWKESSSVAATCSNSSAGSSRNGNENVAKTKEQLLPRVSDRIQARRQKNSGIAAVSCKQQQHKRDLKATAATPTRRLCRMLKAKLRARPPKKLARESAVRLKTAPAYA